MGSKGVVDELSPEGDYELELSDPLDFQMCAELVALRMVHGDKSWAGATFNGKSFTLTDDMVRDRAEAQHLPTRSSYRRAVHGFSFPLQEHHALWVMVGDGEQGWPEHTSRKPTDRVTLEFVEAPTVLHHGGAMADDAFHAMWLAVRTLD